MRKNPGLDLIIVFKTVASAYIVGILKFSFLANSLYRLGSEEVTTIVSIQNEINCSSSLISGIIFLQVDDKSSKLYFQNPNNIYVKCDDDICITPEPGLLLMWPSWLAHGSGDDTNMSTERIVVSFNTYFRKETNAEKTKS